MDALIGGIMGPIEHDENLSNAIDELEGLSPDEWLRVMFPSYVSVGFAERHLMAWEWVYSIESGTSPPPFIAIWPRGGGKSTTAELAVCNLACRRVRKYALYVRETQEQADNSISNVASMLESDSVDRYYSSMGQRLLNKHGNSKGWRRNRVRTESGFTVDAIGLDTAARGAKVDEDRPDLIILDDIDGKHDTAKTTKKKIATLTDSILPAGSTDVAVLGIQNLIIPKGVFSQLANGGADFLSNRIVSGPHPAANKLQYEVGLDGAVVTGGEPTWQGQDLKTIESQMRLWGIRAFMREAQHEVSAPEGALWVQSLIDKHRVSEYPDLERIVVGIDPASETGETGVVTAGRALIDDVYHFYVLRDSTTSADPKTWATAAITAYDAEMADFVIYERNQGGKMVAHTLRVYAPNLPIGSVHASRGKISRAEPIQALYSAGRVHHVGHFVDLESQMTTYVPGNPSPDRMDALVWALTELSATWGSGGDGIAGVGDDNGGADEGDADDGVGSIYG